MEVVVQILNELNTKVASKEVEDLLDEAKKWKMVISHHKSFFLEGYCVHN